MYAHDVFKWIFRGVFTLFFLCLSLTFVISLIGYIVTHIN
jgi:hypothetical protein